MPGLTNLVDVVESGVVRIVGENCAWCGRKVWSAFFRNERGGWSLRHAMGWHR